jgi:hypothetical protein
MVADQGFGVRMSDSTCSLLRGKISGPMLHRGASKTLFWHDPPVTELL